MEEQRVADVDAGTGVSGSISYLTGQSITLFSICVCCSIVFGLFFVMNLVLWSKGSSGAVPFSTLVALLALWFCVSVPLTFVGAYFGFRKRVS